MAPTLGPVVRTAVLMDTFVAIQVVHPPATDACAEAVERAFAWFREVEQRCSRFDEQSEVMNLTQRVGTPVAVSSLLFSTVQFALTVAEASGGAFDPTVGHTLEARGFNRDYRTGRRVDTGLDATEGCTYRDVRLDPEQQTITLLRPAILDLGAVAKGLAIDLAARELEPFGDFSVDAGGDLFVRGHNAQGKPWRVGIRHPRQQAEFIDVLRLADTAICTSGDYERTVEGEGEGHHIIDPRTGHSSAAVASVTVIAPTALAADALGTAAFVLGPKRGRRFLTRQGVDGLIVTTALERFPTPGFSKYREEGLG